MQQCENKAEVMTSIYPDAPSLGVLVDASLPWLAPTMFQNFNYLLIAGSGPGSAYSPPTRDPTTWSKVRAQAR